MHSPSSRPLSRDLPFLENKRMTIPLSYSTPFVIVVAPHGRRCAVPEVHEVEEVEGPPIFIHSLRGGLLPANRARHCEDW
jgi:hypothetical protein